MKPLTKRQQEILDFMLDYQRREGLPAAIREIARNHKTTINGVFCQLALMRKKGSVVHREGRTNRCWQAIDPRESEAVELLREARKALVGDYMYDDLIGRIDTFLGRLEVSNDT